MNISGNDVKNDFKEKNTMFATHNHTEEHANGSKEITQKDIETSYESYCKGDKWLFNSNRPDTDPDHAHYRKDKSFSLVKEKSIFEDKNGNQTTEEKAVKTEDGFECHGVSIIGDGAEDDPDTRASQLENFSSNSDPFQQIANKDNNNLLLGR